MTPADDLPRPTGSAKKSTSVDIKNLPDLLTVREVADLLRVSPLTIKRWGKRGKLDAILSRPSVPHPWQSLWQSYREHALCLAGRHEEALRLATTAWPVDIYEWVHHFETLLRLGRLDLFEPKSFRSTLRGADESKWTTLACRRMLADHQRLTAPTAELDREYRELIDEYDRAGLPAERALVRLGYGRLLISENRKEEAVSIAEGAIEIARRYAMPLLEADARALRDGSEGRP